MVKCERCGTGYGPIQAAVLEFCPRCKARDRVNVGLIVARVREGSAQAGGRVSDAGQPHCGEHAADRDGRARRPGEEDVTGE